MTVRAQMQVQKPDDIQVTLTITMSVGHWKELSSQLLGAWPSWDFGRAIDECTRQIEGRVYATEPKP